VIPKQQVRCVYVAIGQKGTTIASVKRALEEGGAMEYTTIVAAPASDPAGFKWRPLHRSAIGQHWMYDGKHVLIVFDDLTKQADAYRAISLLLRRPPGRERSRWTSSTCTPVCWMRCAKLSDELGGGSMTGLPIIETKANDISAFIPTNVISITDGQCFLESDLFNTGRPPGRQRRCVGVPRRWRRADQGNEGSGRKSPLDLSQYRELEAFASSPRIWTPPPMAQLTAVCVLVELPQASPQYSPLAVEDRSSRSSSVPRATWISVPAEGRLALRVGTAGACQGQHADILTGIKETKKLSEEAEEKLVKVINDFKKGFSASDGSSVVATEHDADALDPEDLEKESVKSASRHPRRPR
jgi:F-type H+-transporting ATPase subunit alpha